MSGWSARSGFLRHVSLGLLLAFAVTAVQSAAVEPQKSPSISRSKEIEMEWQVNKSDQQWSCELTPEQYRVLREKGTEYPGTGVLLHEKRKGEFVCAACGALLFRSTTKYESGSGWPSFWDVAHAGAIKTITDTTHGMTRIEVVCAKCGGHLGHVFEDGPRPTGLRYCINSLALHFEPDNGQ